MGQPRDEIAGGRQSVALREADDRRQAVGVSRRNQYHGLGAPDGHGVESGQRGRSGAGDSTYSQGETANGSTRGLELAQTRVEPAPRAAKARQGRRMPGSRAPIRPCRRERILPPRSADPEMLA